MTYPFIIIFKLEMYTCKIIHTAVQRRYLATFLHCYTAEQFLQATELYVVGIRNEKDGALSKSHTASGARIIIIACLTAALTDDLTVVRCEVAGLIYRITEPLHRTRSAGSGGE